MKRTDPRASAAQPWPLAKHPAPWPRWPPRRRLNFARCRIAIWKLNWSCRVCCCRSNLMPDNHPSLRIALAGCGGVVRRYRRTYQSLPGVQVVAAIDVNQQEAQQAAAELNASRVSTSFADALGD